MENIIFIGTILLCFAGVVTIFSRQVKLLDKQLHIAKTTKIEVACAGSVMSNTPYEIRVQGFNSMEFRNKGGNSIDTNQFGKYWVRGSSMLLCGILDNDLLLTRTISLDKIKFPTVVVLQRDKDAKAKAAAKNDFAEMKVRRAWAVSKIDADKTSLLNCVRDIIHSEQFMKLKELHPEAFLSESEMLDDFENERISNYMRQYPSCINDADENNKAIISTTLKSSKGNKVTFSIHPARLVKGKVIYSFKIPQS